MRTAVGTETSESPISVSPMYTNRPKSVILDGVDGKCILAGEHDGPMAFPTPTSSATSSTSQEESSSDGGSTLAIDDVDKSSSSYSNSDAYSATNSYNGNSLYSVQLPGFGKVLALNSEKSCDVDILYEEQKKAMDVDAFVGVDTDDEEDQDFPVYTSTLPKRWSRFQRVYLQVAKMFTLMISKQIISHHHWWWIVVQWTHWTQILTHLHNVWGKNYRGATLT